MSENSSQRKYHRHEDSCNCLLICKLILILLIVIAMVVFFVYFIVQDYRKLNIDEADFINCTKGDETTIILNTDQYNQVIFGLAIASLVGAVWIFFHLTLILSYFSDSTCCVSKNIKYDQQQSQLSSFQAELKLQMVQSISRPKSTIQINNQPIKLPSDKLRQQKQSRIKKRSYKQHHDYGYYRQDLKPQSQIKRIEQLQKDCECQDLCQCLTYCFRCFCCRTCCDAHKFIFYRSKGEQIFFWILYFLKTCCIGTFLGFVIAIYVSLDRLNYCFTDNIRNYFDKVNILLIIGIIVFCLDVIGYMSMFIEGTLCERTLYYQNRRRRYHSMQKINEDNHIKKNKKKDNKMKEQLIQDQRQENSGNKLIEFKYNKKPQIQGIDLSEVRLKQLKSTKLPYAQKSFQSKNYQPRWRQQQRRPEIEITRMQREPNQQQQMQMSRFTNKYDRKIDGKEKFGRYNS